MFAAVCSFEVMENTRRPFASRLTSVAVLKSTIELGDWPTLPPLVDMVLEKSTRDWRGGEGSRAKKGAAELLRGKTTRRFGVRR